MYPTGALKACTRRVNGQKAKSANATMMCTLKSRGTSDMSSALGWR